MYQKFFGLRESPFNVTPDPRYLFLTKQIQEALAGLTYGIQNRKGFILLTGEVGTGKTTLLNRLLDWLHGQRVATAFVFNSQVNVSQLFDFMMADFEIPCETRHKSQVLLRLNAWLLDRYRAGETAVLIVDEAQNLSLQVLEEIRLLGNLENRRGVRRQGGSAQTARRFVRTDENQRLGHAPVQDLVGGVRPGRSQRQVGVRDQPRGRRADHRGMPKPRAGA